MTITLPGELSEFVRRQVEGGAYPSESAVVADAVRLLKEHAPAAPNPGAPPAETRPIWEIAAEIAASLPPEVVAQLPVDGAEQHDHYIYGTPKKPPEMTERFADTLYWVAILNPRDQWHARALALSRSVVTGRMVTTDAVLDELLAHFSGHAPAMRLNVAGFVRSILADPMIVVLPQERASFLDGLDLFEARLDKGYSLTDCMSMVVMRNRGIAEGLSATPIFARRGFATFL